ncbi:apolipoprotein N-acyltransferase [Luteococcus peritonei]|uniref:Apolipoprotein N-acyltransferase n=1 Tax=Luteococcus peritonei TaxID=88874 RepID=A0ABW4RW08_9ACTN
MRRPAERSASWGERALALLLGGLAGLAWQPTALWQLVFPALAALGWLVLRGEHASADGARAVPLRRGFSLGWIFGLGLGLVSLSWVAVIGWYVVPPLLCLMALWQGLVGLVSVAAARFTRSPLARAALVACGWSLAEFGASRIPFGGFGWMRLGYTQVDSPLAGWLPLLGVGGVSWLVALCSGLLLVLLQPALARAQRLLALGLVMVLLLGGALVGRAIGPGRATGTVNVGMVQGNVDGSAGPEAMGYARSVTQNHVSQTVTLMARARTGIDPVPDFVLWPENSTDIDPTRDAQTRDLVRRASAISALPILVGAVMEGPGADERQTSALWWLADGTTTARYDKRNLVPFGEWIPLRAQLLPVLPVLEQVGAQSVPGTGPGVLDVRLGADGRGRELRIGDIICFELAWDRTVHETVTNGAQLLVVQSNNGTYTGTGQPQQQFAITRARAMELRREIVVSTTNSLSGLVHADGSVSGATREGTAAAQTFTVPTREGRTPAVQTGPAIELVASLAAVALVVLALARAAAGRTRRTG